MFSFHNFIKKGFLNAVGKLADYQIILNAAGWYDKGVLLEEDLAEIQSALDAFNAAQIPDAETPSGDDAGDADTPSGTEASPTRKENETAASV